MAEIIAKRATPDCDKETREKWIKAKYMLKAFINPHALKTSSSDSSDQEVSKTHWTVRRLRRRARNSSLKKQITAKESKDKDEKDEDTSQLQQQLPRDDSESSILEACGLTSSGSTAKTINENVINAEKLVFGGTLSKHHVASIEVNTHQLPICKFKYFRLGTYFFASFITMYFWKLIK